MKTVVLFVQSPLQSRVGRGAPARAPSIGGGPIPPGGGRRDKSNDSANLSSGAGPAGWLQSRRAAPSDNRGSLCGVSTRNFEKKSGDSTWFVKLFELDPGTNNFLDGAFLFRLHSLGFDQVVRDK